MHAPSQEGRQREEQVRLVHGGQPAGPAPRPGLFVGVRDGADFDVRVEVDVIGVAVMAIVLLHPPAVAHAEQQVGRDQADESVLPSRDEHLAVSRVVKLEAELAAHDAESRGRKGLRPDRPDRDQGDQAEDQQHRVGGDAEGVVSGLLLEQPGVLDAALEDRVLGLVFEVDLAARLRYGSELGCHWQRQGNGRRRNKGHNTGGESGLIRAMKIRAARLTLAAIAAVWAVAGSSAAVHADEGWVITSFQSDINIAADSTLTVKEDIRVDFGTLQKHAIVTTIPLRYRYDDSHV